MADAWDDDWLQKADVSLLGQNLLDVIHSMLNSLNRRHPNHLEIIPSSRKQSAAPSKPNSIGRSGKMRKEFCCMRQQFVDYSPTARNPPTTTFSKPTMLCP